MFNIPTWRIGYAELGSNQSSQDFTIDTSDVPFAPRHLLLRVNGRSTRGTTNAHVEITLNDDTGSNYHTQSLYGSDSSTTAARNNSRDYLFRCFVPGTSVDSDAFGGGECLIPDAFSTRTHKSFVGQSGTVDKLVWIEGGRWANTAAITKVTFTIDANEMLAGTILEVCVVDESFNISEQILGSDGTFSVSDIAAADGDLVCIGNLRAADAVNERLAFFLFNSDSSAGNYARQRLRGSGSSASAYADSDRRVAPLPGGNMTASAYGAFLSQITNFSDGSNDRVATTLSGYHGNSSTSKVQVNYQRWNNTAAINELFLDAEGTDFETDSMLSVYAVPKNLIERQELSGTATTVTFDNIPQSYDHLELVCYTRNDRYEDSSTIQGSFNNDTTAANYDTQHLQGVGSSLSASSSAADRTLALTSGNKNGANMFSPATITIYNYTKTDRHKHWISSSGINSDLLDVGRIISGRWEDTDVITEIDLTVGSGDDFMAGSVFELRGIRAEQNPAANFEIPDITQQDGDIVLVGNLRTDRALQIDDGLIWFNGDNTASNYGSQQIYAYGSTVSAQAPSHSLGLGWIAGDTATRNAFSAAVGQITNYSDGSNDRAYNTLAGGHHAGTGSYSSSIAPTTGRWNNTAAITDLEVDASNGTGFVANSMLSSYLVPKNLIERVELGAAANITFSNIPQSYDHLELSVYSRSDVSGSVRQYGVQFNGDTTNSNYERQTLYGTSTTVATFQHSSPVPGIIPGSTSPANVFGSDTISIQNYSRGDRHKSALILGGYTTRPELQISSGRWKNTDPITQIQLNVDGSDEFDVGTIVELRGIRTETNAPQGFTVNGIPQLAGDVLLIGNLRTDRSYHVDNCNLFLNGDETNGNYAQQVLQGYVSTTLGAAYSAPHNVFAGIPGDAAQRHAFGAAVGLISNHAEGVNDPSVLSLSGSHNSSSETYGGFVSAVSTRRNNVEAVTSMKVSSDNATGFVPGSMLSAYHIPKNIIAMKRLESDTATVTFSDIPQDYKHLKLSIYGKSRRTGVTSDSVGIKLNSDGTSGNYDNQRLVGYGSSINAYQDAGNRTRWMQIPDDTTANLFGGGTLTIQNYAKTDRHKHLSSVYGNPGNGVTLYSGRWENTSAVTEIFLQPGNGDDFVAGSLFVLEGIGKESLTWEEDEPIDIDSKVFVDWGNDGKYDGTYDNISADVLKASIRGGRDVASALTGKVKAARVTLTVANDDDRYSPFNTSSVLTGNLVPKRSVKIKTESPVERDLFTGQIERIAPAVAANRSKIARITCLGVLGQLTQNEVNIAYQASIGSGDAIDDILDAASWGATDRTIDAGTQTFKNWDVDSVQAITALRRVEESESGLLVESKEGKIAFEDRDHRMGLPHIVAQSEYSDDPTAKGVLRYESIRELDPLRFIYNDFRATVRKKATNAGVTLWTHSEANTTGDAPEIEAGDSVTYWAHYPNLASRTDGTGVAAWTALVATTDYTANSLSNGTGTDHTSDLTIVETDFAKSKKIEITNDASVNVFLTKLQNRGTEIYELDPVSVQAEDATSQTAYGQRTFVRSDLAVWIPDSLTAQEWVDYNLSLYKDPSPMVGITVTGQKNLYHAIDVLTRTISDRVGIEADGNAGLGVNEDFFVENWAYDIVPKRLTANFELSSAAAFSAYWTLGYSLLGTETRLNPT